MKYNKTRNGGFTLLGVLVTVAILVIMLGLAAVGVARYRDYLKITELDNAARDIYMAAENRAVLLQNSGRVGTPSASLLSSIGSGTVDEKNVRILSNTPPPVHWMNCCRWGASTPPCGRIISVSSMMRPPVMSSRCSTQRRRLATI